MTDTMRRASVFDDPISRRTVFSRMAQAALGVTVYDTLAGQPAAAHAAAAPTGSDVSVIFLMMRGAMSHLDTFDPKPGREEQGETKAIQTKTPGVLFGEHLPKLAGMADRLAVIRSMTTETGDHGQGTYLMRTSYSQINSIVHPSMGSWTLHVKGKQSRDLPGYVLVGNGNEHPGAGFLDASLTPVPIADNPLLCRRDPCAAGLVLPSHLHVHDGARCRSIVRVEGDRAAGLEADGQESRMNETGR